MISERNYKLFSAFGQLFLLRIPNFLFLVRIIMNTVELYDNYKKIRDQLGMKDSQVATLTGIPRSTFTDWKQGRSCPKIDKIKKIADALNTSPDFIFITKSNPLSIISILDTEDEKQLQKKAIERLETYKKFLKLNSNDQQLVENLINTLSDKAP